MQKIISILSFLIMNTFSNSLYSDSLGAFAAKEYNLLPNQTLTLVNPLSKTINAQCEVRVISNENHSVLIKILSGSGVINGTSLKQGDTLVQTVHQLQIILLTANAGAKAQFTNLGPYVIKANCST